MSNHVDPFASVRIRKSQDQNQFKNEVSKNETEDPFISARIKKVEGFPYLKEGTRHLARTASRAAEVLGGTAGDIGKLIQSGVFSGLEKLTGIKTPEKAREEAKKFRTPTSKELKEISQNVTGGFTTPQNEIEKLSDESVETLSSLLGPMKFRKAIGVALGSQLAKEGTKIAGLSENTQEAAKLGTMFFLSMLNPGGAMKYSSNLYNKADELSKGASIAAPKLQKELITLKSNLKKGLTTPGKEAVLKPTQELLDKIKNGKISVHELTAAKRDISSLIKNPEMLKREKKLLKLLGRYIDQGLKPYEKINPEFSKAYRPANEIYSAVMEGSKASDFIKKNLGSKSILGAILGETILGHPEYILPTAASATGIYGGAKTVDFLTRLAKSKELQKYYSRAALAAAKEDLPAVRKYEEEIKKNLE